MDKLELNIPKLQNVVVESDKIVADEGYANRISLKTLKKYFGSNGFGKTLQRVE